MENKELVTEYPWLTPRDWKDEIPEDYDFSYTLLDAMPIGWRKAFGEEMQKELKSALGDGINEYKIWQIKEKFGSLCWYDSGGNDETEKIVRKYEMLSANICIKCGKPDVPYVTSGWIFPVCKDCYEGADYERATEGSTSEMKTIGSYTWYTINGEYTYGFDYSDTAKKIRDKYKEKAQ